MPIDPQISFQALTPPGPSALQTLGPSVYKFGQEQQQQRQQEQLTDIFARNIQTTPEGTQQLNRQGVLAELYQTEPQAAFKFEQGWAAQDARQKAAEGRGALFAPTKMQKLVGRDGLVRNYDPSTGKITFALDEAGKNVEAADYFTYKETPEGYVPLSTKRPPTVAPEPVKGLTPAARKTRELTEKKIEVSNKRADLALQKATKDAAMGGQFKTPQYEAGMYGIRMMETETILDDLITEGFDATKITYAMMKRGPEYFKPGPLKRFIQAQRSFINATLRRESGAAIAQSEFDNAERQYFPQVGDTQAVLAQKKKNRQIVQAGMKAESGGAWGEITGALGTIRGETPKTQEVDLFETPTEGGLDTKGL